MNMKSFLINNIIIDRNQPVDGGLFVQTSDGDILARLDGFVVVPIEKVPDLNAFLRSVGVNANPPAVPV